MENSGGPNRDDSGGASDPLPRVQTPPQPPQSQTPSPTVPATKSPMPPVPAVTAIVRRAGDDKSQKTCALWRFLKEFDPAVKYKNWTCSVLQKMPASKLLPERHIACGRLFKFTRADRERGIKGSRMSSLLNHLCNNHNAEFPSRKRCVTIFLRPEIISRLILPSLFRSRHFLLNHHPFLSTKYFLAMPSRPQNIALLEIAIPSSKPIELDITVPSRQENVFRLPVPRPFKKSDLKLQFHPVPSIFFPPANSPNSVPSRPVTTFCYHVKP